MCDRTSWESSCTYRWGDARFSLVAEGVGGSLHMGRVAGTLPPSWPENTGVTDDGVRKEQPRQVLFY